MAHTWPMQRAIAATMLATATLTACTGWEVQPVAPEQLLATKHPSSVRVTQKGGYQFVVDSPRISGDSLVGAVGGQSSGVPLANISAVAVQHASVAKAVGITLVVAAIAAVIFIVLEAAAMGSGS